ncbi:phage tail protein I [Tumebacillus permanentifrigoris]|uniref:Phage tail P2-like protein n=1 Tax=Tumebacillus permanentifrigoris TaxID=378543 RepID=A0A316DDG7_9BACL|nr:phage tail protein I [Tumebacillus permanentifrigoris]PWK16054.1 phage tail P2-like protein [Tumebacillus permanentifrigoris]
MRSLLDIHLLELVPPNLRRDSDVEALAEAINQQLLAITQAIPTVAILQSLDSLSAEMVDELAWQFHVDFYDPTLPIEQRRELVKKSLAWHRRKGTPAAVEELITTLFGEGHVEEWFDYGGAPFSFRVHTNNKSVTQERALEFTRAVNSVKNARSILEKVVVGDSENFPLYYGGAIHIGDNLTIRQV